MARTEHSPAVAWDGAALAAGWVEKANEAGNTALIALRHLTFTTPGTGIITPLGGRWSSFANRDSGLGTP